MYVQALVNALIAKSTQELQHSVTGTEEGRSTCEKPMNINWEGKRLEQLKRKSPNLRYKADEEACQPVQNASQIFPSITECKEKIIEVKARDYGTVFLLKLVFVTEK